MTSPKPLIMPWLVRQIDSGRYPGLHWTNQERTEFRIPWKHGLRQDLSPEDSSIFKAWAVASGRFREGLDPADPPVWKRNFRSALNRKGVFEVICDNSSDSEEPHKIYRLCERRAQERREEERRGETGARYEPEVDLYSSSVSQDVDLDEILRELNLHGGVSADPCHDDSAPCGAEGVLQFLPSPLQYENLSPVHIPVQDGNPSPAAESEGAGAPCVAEEPLQQFKAQLSGIHNRLTTHFRVVAYYRGLKVHEQLVTNENGFRVHAAGAEPVMSHLQGVCLPDPSPLLDKRQAELTKRILGKLGGGLAVEVSGSSILGARLGDSKAYWSCSQFDQSRTPREVPKIETEIYNTNQFIKDLISFIENRSGSPQFCLWFCVGEKWPDPENRPWEKKLIMIEVTPISLELLKSLAVCGGASSLQSETVELQISTETSSILSLLYESMDTS